jgi:hypothetical protein
MLRALDQHNHRITEKRKQEFRDQINYQAREDFRHWQRYWSEDMGYTSAKAPEQMSRVYL